MGAWKRQRGWTERHGWGPAPLARWIGRQRREARRPTGRPLPAVTNLETEYETVARVERSAAELYFGCDITSVSGSTFDALRIAWERAEDRRAQLFAARQHVRRMEAA